MENGKDQLIPPWQRILSMPLSVSAEKEVELAYAKDHGCGTLVAMLIAAIEA